ELIQQDNLLTDPGLTILHDHGWLPWSASISSGWWSWRRQNRDDGTAGNHAVSRVGGGKRLVSWRDQGGFAPAGISEGVDPAVGRVEEVVERQNDSRSAVGAAERHHTRVVRI